MPPITSYQQTNGHTSNKPPAAGKQLLNSPPTAAPNLMRRKTSEILSSNATSRLMVFGRPDTPRPVNEESPSAGDDGLEAGQHNNNASNNNSNVVQLPTRLRWSYGVGHVLNDLTASFWFSYLLVFLRSVLQFHGTAAGLLLLIGQLADGIATPVAGFLSDKTTRIRAEHLLLRENSESKSHRIGGAGRKVWIGVGSLVLGLTYPPVFHGDIFNIPQSSTAARVAYYSVFIITLQFAWACVQVSHLAMVPELTPAQGERVYLNSLRSCFTILSGFAVYTLCYFLFDSTTTHGAANSGLTPSDESTFFLLSLIIVCTGAVFVCIFLVGVSEPAPRLKPAHVATIEWTDWLKQWQFHATAVIYACTRILVNVGQCYLPLWLLYSIGAPKASIATMPLIM